MQKAVLLLEKIASFFERPKGKSIQLTVDHELQHKLTQELIAVTERFDAETAIGVILDVQTSQILAMGNYPFF